MKKILLGLLALVAVIGVVAPMIGGTLATWSDSETSIGNYLETGSLDLKVKGPVDPSWADDQPWGVGLKPCFWITDGQISLNYTRTVELWNAGDTDGDAYLHIKNVQGCQSTYLYLWVYFDGVLVVEGYLKDLDCTEILLGLLPACNPRDVVLILRAEACVACVAATWDIEFDLGSSCGWSDSESCSNYFEAICGLDSTPGFWRSPAAERLYGRCQLADWFRFIVMDSDWFEDELARGDCDERYANMTKILKSGGAANYIGAVNQFRSQYLATRLATMPDPPRLALGTWHVISGISSNGIEASGYFGSPILTLQQIINTIESKASGGIFSEPPSRHQMLCMMTVCGEINNLRA